MHEGLSQNGDNGTAALSRAPTQQPRQLSIQIICISSQPTTPRCIKLNESHTSVAMRPLVQVLLPRTLLSSSVCSAPSHNAVLTSPLSILFHSMKQLMLCTYMYVFEGHSSGTQATSPRLLRSEQSCWPCKNLSLQTAASATA